MFRMGLMAGLAAGVIMIAAGSSGHAGDATGGQGQQVFEQRCSGCHALDRNRFGPALGGVFGRRAATAPGYRYSEGLRSSGIVWDERTLDLWLQNPGAMVRGARMPARVKDAEERSAVIAYLRAQSTTGAR